MFNSKCKYIYITFIIYFFLICLGTKTKVIEVQPSTIQDPEIVQSNEQCNNDNGNALLPY